ncbi:MAG: glycosyltransferase family 4 protein [Candidatus Bathyarchaeia archaeon]|jgi:glycosyltransferase involved in cell wall biosynthesis
MNILVISLYYPPDMGGASNRAGNAVAGLVKQGHHVKVIAGYPHYPLGNISKKFRKKALIKETRDGVDIFRVWVPPLPTRGMFKRGLIYLTFMFSSFFPFPWLGSIDGIFYVSPFSSTFIIPGLFYRVSKKARLILDCGDMWPNSAVDLGFIKSNGLIKLAKYTSYVSYRLADGIAPINNAIKAGILTNYGIQNKKVHVIELGINTEVFKPLPKDTILEEKEGLTGKFVVMYSGILGPAYDFGTIIKAAKLLEVFPEIAFVIRGDGELKRRISQQIKLKRPNNIIMLPKVDNQIDVVRYLNLADVFVLPMQNVKVSATAIPSKVYEFLSCGKPVICCAEGELPNLLKTLSAGLTVGLSDSKGLAHAILNLYQDRQLTGKLGKNARDNILKNYSDVQIGIKLEECFSKQSNREGPSAP